MAMETSAFNRFYKPLVRLENREPKRQLLSLVCTRLIRIVSNTDYSNGVVAAVVALRSGGLGWKISATWAPRGNIHACRQDREFLV